MTTKYYKFIVLFIALVASLSALVVPVYAHFLKTDGSIGAVMHVDPEDEPIAGAQSGFFFEFKDTAGKFKPADCDCVFSISESGKQIFSQPLFASSTAPSLSSASVFFTFPQKDVYQVEVRGKPYSGASFQAFRLVYDVRVERETTNLPVNNSAISNDQLGQWLQAHVVHFVAIGVIVIFFGFAVAKNISERKKTQK